MIGTADSRRRVVLPFAEPGDVFDIQVVSEGKFLLTKLEPFRERPNPARFEKRGKYTVLMTERPVNLHAIREALADFP